MDESKLQMCKECPHKDMHTTIQFFSEYPDTPHPCHMVPNGICRGAYLELKMRGWLRKDWKLNDKVS